MHHTLEIRTRGKGLYPCTREVAQWVASTKAETGLLTLFIRHTSASLVIQENADPDVVLPGRIDKRFAGWDKELSGFNIVMVHSKVVVLDPFGSAPVVMTGSHNLGPTASEDNDDNLNLIAGAPRLAQAYATNIIAVYNDYRWRYVRSQAAKEAGKDWEGPEDGKAWQDSYYSGKDAAAKQRELSFWLGE